MRLPLATLESKILCRHHNGELSKVDAEAIRIFKFLGEALEAVRHPPKKKQLLPKRYEADGRLFERWCAKTLIDCACVERSKTRWHATGTIGSLLRDPPPGIINAVFGLTKFSGPLGLYLAQESTAQAQEVLREEFSVDPLFHPVDDGLMGAFLSFRDYRFLLWLNSEPFESFYAETRSGVSFGDSGNPAHYHPDSLKVAVNYVAKHKVILRWR
jgi:hypothetical protein